MSATGRGIQRPIQAVLFDLGGTLIYENGPWEPIFPRADEALWNVLRQAGVALEPREVYDGSDNLFSMYYSLHRGDLTEPTSANVLDELLRKKGVHMPKEMLQAGLQAMYAVTQSNWLPETDALPTLQGLKARGYRIGLISNAADDGNTQALIDKGSFRPYFEYIISSAAFGMRKPHPGIFRSALESLGCPPAQGLMVGDNFEADIAGAAQVGMQSIWITRRIRDTRREAFGVEPNAVISALSEIPALLPEK